MTDKKSMCLLPVAQRNLGACVACGLARPLAISITEFCRLASVGRTTAFALIRNGKIEVRRIGGRTLVLTRSVDRLLSLSEEDNS